jgi:hypothetical protein
MKRLHIIGAIVVLIIVIGVIVWQASRSPMDKTKQGSGVTAGSGVGSEPPGMSAGNVPACTSEQVKSIGTKFGTTLIDGVEANILPGACVPSRDGRYLTFALSDVDATADPSMAPISSDLRTMSDMEVAAVCDRLPTCVAWVNGPSGSRFYGSIPRGIIGNMSSKVGMLAGAF